MAVVEEPTPHAVVPETVRAVNLPTGKALSDGEASRLLRGNTAPVVLLVGAVESGKTTLIASLHDSFQWEPFAGYLAAGSQTLMGFEERCFDSRHASEAVKPFTERTKFEEGHLFYHLKVRNENLETPIQHLLLVDMSGEYFERAIDSAAEMRDLTIIRRADQFVHLVDGKTLVSEDLRTRTESIAMMLMRRCFEEEMLGPDARVDILLTKWDLVLARCGEQVARGIAQSYQSAFAQRFNPRVARLRVVPIAARPHYKSALKPASGLAELFRSWVEEPPRQVIQRMRNLILPRVSRPFDAFAIHEAPDMFERES